MISWVPIVILLSKVVKFLKIHGFCGTHGTRIKSAPELDLCRCKQGNIHPFVLLNIALRI